MSLEKFTETVRSKVGDNANLNSTIKFAFKEGGALFIDGKSTGAVRVSVALASNFEDVRRFVEFARGLLSAGG